MDTHQTYMTKEGRVLIPAAVRKALGLSPDQPLALYVEDGEVRITSRVQALRRMQARMAKYRDPSQSAVDELLHERRADAERE